MSIIKWGIISKAYDNPISKACDNPEQDIGILCLTEKLWTINFRHDHNYLHKKSELINKCKYTKKLLLKNVKRYILTAVLHFMDV